MGENQQPNHNEYKTAELALAAGLVTLGYQFLRLDGDNPSRLFFVFAYDEEIERLETAHYAGKMLVDTLGYSTAHRRMKDLIMQRRKKMP